MAQYSFKVTKRANSYNDWSLTMKGITLGNILAIHRALQLYKDQSPVANDVFGFLDDAIKEAGIDVNNPRIP